MEKINREHETRKTKNKLIPSCAQSQRGKKHLTKYIIEQFFAALVCAN